MTNNIIDITPNKKNCKKCSAQEKLTSLPISLVIFSIYFIISSVYGTVEIIKDIIALF
jgi:hypothetical protein